MASFSGRVSKILLNAFRVDEKCGEYLTKGIRALLRFFDQVLQSGPVPPGLAVADLWSGWYWKGHRRTSDRSLERGRPHECQDSVELHLRPGCRSGR